MGIGNAKAAMSFYSVVVMYLASSAARLSPSAMRCALTSLELEYKSQLLAASSVLYWKGASTFS